MAPLVRSSEQHEPTNRRPPSSTLPGPDDPVAWSYVEADTLVVGPDGEELGRVAAMLGTETEGIFHGVAVTPYRDGVTRVVPADAVTMHHERAGRRSPRTRTSWPPPRSTSSRGRVASRQCRRPDLVDGCGPIPPSTSTSTRAGGLHAARTAAAGRPLVAINMVTSIDGRAQLAGTAEGLGSRADRRLMRHYRAAFDAVGSGAGTLRGRRRSGCGSATTWPRAARARGPSAESDRGRHRRFRPRPDRRELVRRRRAAHPDRRRRQPDDRGARRDRAAARARSRGRPPAGCSTGLPSAGSAQPPARRAVRTSTPPSSRTA